MARVVGLVDAARSDCELLERTIREVHKSATRWEFVQTNLGTWLVHSRGVWAMSQIVQRPGMGSKVVGAAIRLLSSVCEQRAVLVALLRSATAR